MAEQVSNYFANTGGINNTDSPLFMQDDQAVVGYNYDYDSTGAVTKRRGNQRLSASPNTQLTSHAFGLHINSMTNTRTLLRAGGTKLQTVSITSAATVDQETDTATPTSDFFTNGATDTAKTAVFNNGVSNITWLAGAGATSIFGYNGTKVTVNGAVSPAGSISTLVTGSGGDFTSTGTYWYAVVLRKASTGIVSNATLDVSAIVAATTDEVHLDLSTITAFDQTKYDQVWIYRSATNGTEEFTSGDLIAQLPAATASYNDLGDSIASALLIPRPGNVSEDHSTIPSFSPTTLATWKNRLCASNGNICYISEFNQSEYWPIDAEIVVPTGGTIKALGVVGFSTQFSIDEKLVIWTDTEMWAVTGSGLFDDETGLYDYTLTFVDNIGLQNQSCAVRAFGNIAWLNYRGVFMWNGSGKPVRISKFIEGFFTTDGDLDTSKLAKAYAVYYTKDNKIFWVVSDSIHGENKLIVKLDLRLTMSKTPELQGNYYELGGVFTLDTWTTSCYAGIAYIPDNTVDEVYISGDNSGFIYKMSVTGSDPDSTGVQFSYKTKPYTFDLPHLDKHYRQVVVWVDNIDANADLTLNYWTSFKTNPNQASTIATTLESMDKSTGAVWDIAYWDNAYWDSYNLTARPLFFNLNGSELNNSQGVSIQLEFVQSDANVPVKILGWAIRWTESNIRNM